MGGEKEKKRRRNGSQHLQAIYRRAPRTENGLGYLLGYHGEIRVGSRPLKRMRIYIISVATARVKCWVTQFRENLNDVKMREERRIALASGMYSWLGNNRSTCFSYIAIVARTSSKWVFYNTVPTVSNRIVQSNVLERCRYGSMLYMLWPIPT